MPYVYGCAGYHRIWSQCRIMMLSRVLSCCAARDKVTVGPRLSELLDSLLEPLAEDRVSPQEALDIVTGVSSSWQAGPGIGDGCIVNDQLKVCSLLTHPRRVVSATMGSLALLAVVEALASFRLPSCAMAGKADRRRKKAAAQQGAAASAPTSSVVRLPDGSLYR